MTNRRLAREPRGIDPESGKQVYGRGRQSWGGPAKEARKATDEITGEPLAPNEVETVVLEGEGRPGKKPRRIISVSSKNKAELLRLAGKTEAKDEGQIVPEHFLETLRTDLAKEKGES